MSERPVTVWLTLAQVANRLQVSARTVRREIDDGRLPAARVRGIMRIDPADLAVYFEEQKAACRSAATEIAGRSDYGPVVADALNELFPRARPAGTRKRSRLLSAAASSTVRLVSSRGD